MDFQHVVQFMVHFPSDFPHMMFHITIKQFRISSYYEIM